jgi:hypothetical protein
MFLQVKVEVSVVCTEREVDHQKQLSQTRNNLVCKKTNTGMFGTK